MNKPRILFATMPLDGHFNPLTALAVHLQQLGYDVRWYVGGNYGKKVTQLGLHHYPFVKGLVVNQENLDEVFPERKNIKGSIPRLRFDISQVFLLRAPEFIEDLTEIRREWTFDILIHDIGFTAGTLAKELWNVKTIAVGVTPLAETDENLPPSGLGMEPKNDFWGRMQQAFLRYMILKVMFKPCHLLYNEIRSIYHLPPVDTFFFDHITRSADLYFQSGVPGFEYERKQMSPNIRFVGPLLPKKSGRKTVFAHADKLGQYAKVILATQGTVERDPEKILVPTLEAFKDSNYLVIVTTGGSGTAELRARYARENVIIVDFIDFDQLMPHVDVYVTNAGYGGVMLSISKGLPMVAAGVHEGKNEIAARIGYFKLGVNLRTEKPKPEQVRKAVEQVLSNSVYKRNVLKLSQEFNQYQTNELAAGYIEELAAQLAPVHESIVAQ